MPPRLGLYSLADTPEELLSQGYGVVGTEFAEDPAFGTLAYNTVYNPAPYTGDFPFQNVFRINEGQYYGDLDFPSFGGVSGYRDTGGIMRIMQEEEDEEDQLPYSGVGDMRYQTPRTIADQNRILGQTFTEQKPSGIARLFEVLGNIPTPMNILRGGLESLRGFNQRIRNTDFGRSRTLQEYFQRREARKDAERLKTVGQQLQQASDRGGGYQPTSRAQNVARTESRVSGGKSRAYGL